MNTKAKKPVVRALKQRYGLATSPRDILDKLSPPHDIGIPIRDPRPTRKIKQSDLEGDLRLPRDGSYRDELVAAFRHYDGATGGQPGYYANVFIAWRVGTATWRSSGVRILPFEADRIARALDRRTGTRPTAAEPDRISGGSKGTTSELRAKTLAGDSMLVYVVYNAQGGTHNRTRGVEIRDSERAAIAEGLRNFARMRGRAR